MARDYIYKNEDVPMAISIKNGAVSVDPLSLRRVEVFVFHKEEGSLVSKHMTVDGSDPLATGWKEAEISASNVIIYLNGADTKDLPEGTLWIQVDIISDNAKFTDGEERHIQEGVLLKLKNARV